MVTSILENGQITCTLARAKEVRKPLEKMISWGKRGDLHARRHALRFVKSKEAISVLFGELADRYKDRQGGYSRIIKLGKTRLGDNSEMAIVQLLDSDKDTLSSLKSKSSKKKNLKKKDSSVLQEVSEEIQLERETNETNKSKSIEKQETDSEKKNTPDEKNSINKNDPIEKQETDSEKKNGSGEKNIKASDKEGADKKEQTTDNNTSENKP